MAFEFAIEYRHLDGLKAHVGADPVVVSASWLKCRGTNLDFSRLPAQMQACMIPALGYSSGSSAKSVPRPWTTSSWRWNLPVCQGVHWFPLGQMAAFHWLTCTGCIECSRTIWATVFDAHDRLHGYLGFECHTASLYLRSGSH